MRYVILTIGTAFFGATVWAVRFHFTSGRPPLAFIAFSLLSLASFAVFCFHIWQNEPAAVQGVASLLLILAAAAVFASAVQASRQASLKLIFDPTQPQTLVAEGPYHYVRHPFYSSYILYWLGCSLATMHPLNFAFVLILVPVLYAGARREEALFANSPLARSYADYCRMTGMFWPRLLPPDPAG